MKRLVLLVCILMAPLWAVTEYTDAKALVAAVQAKLKTVTDYSMVAFTESPGHAGVLDYRCVRPNCIRTEVLDGPHKGTVIVYDQGVKDKMVKVKSGNKRVWKSIKKLKIDDTPLVQSVLDKFAGDLSSFNFTLKPHQMVKLDIGKAVPQTTNDKDWSFGDDPDVTASASPGTAVPHQTVQKDCYVLDGTHNGDREVLAIDRTTLWPVEIKRWKAGQPDFDAEIWKLEVNTSPKIDF